MRVPFSRDKTASDEAASGNTLTVFPLNGF